MLDYSKKACKINALAYLASSSVTMKEKSFTRLAIGGIRRLNIKTDFFNENVASSCGQFYKLIYARKLWL